MKTDLVTLFNRAVQVRDNGVCVLAPFLVGNSWGNKPSSTTISHEAPLSGDFILLLPEELEHMEFV